ncbi:hypothetical protein TCDM_07179 [Trypanosoma cruzi Dm28c]|uniref:Uncharacterized protein n=1 Tax=Trypanosoma cruzi Dm28c TaxID=1416333 RepID=V5BJL4_TRYCR|nr:hypothetical protein TCDM_07179 [Trypanosoma cruzi Dm28c]
MNRREKTATTTAKETRKKERKKKRKKKVHQNVMSLLAIKENAYQKRKKKIWTQTKEAAEQKHAHAHNKSQQQLQKRNNAKRKQQQVTGPKRDGEVRTKKKKKGGGGERRGKQVVLPSSLLCFRCSFFVCFVCCFSFSGLSFILFYFIYSFIYLFFFFTRDLCGVDMALMTSAGVCAGGGGERRAELLPLPFLPSACSPSSTLVPPLRGENMNRTGRLWSDGVRGKNKTKKEWGEGRGAAGDVTTGVTEELGR